MGEELDRNSRILKEKADPKPYFISYEVTENEFHTLGASLGALTVKNSGRTRHLDVSLRTGSPKLDNYHGARGERAQFTSGSQVSTDDVPAAIKQQIWIETDRAYRAAAERLIKIRSNQQVKVAAEDQSDDFSTEPPSVHSDMPPALHVTVEQWQERLRQLSCGFLRFQEVLSSSVALVAHREIRYFVDTEGSRVVNDAGTARLVAFKRDCGAALGAPRPFDGDAARS